MKKLIALLLALVMVLSLCACGAKEEAPAAAPADDAAEAPAEEAAAGSVYYLNFKPEQDEAWQNLAAEYTAATGVPVTVLTAASGTYEETLMAEMGKTEAPTMFQVNGPVGLANWIDYCYDLSDSELYSHLTSDSFALTEDGAVYGIAYVIESYGIIANKALLAEAGYAVEDINSFETLKAVLKTSPLAPLSWASLPSPPPVWKAPLTGASRPTLQTSPSTLSTRLTASAPPTLSRAPTLTTTRLSGISTPTTAPALPLTWPARPVTTAATSSWQARQSSSRTVPGSTATWPAPSPMTSWL